MSRWSRVALLGALISAATTGTIPQRLFIGAVDEQALAVNVRVKGLVLIAGCSHQTVARLLERTENVFDERIYGIVGNRRDSSTARLATHSPGTAKMPTAPAV